MTLGVIRHILTVQSIAIMLWKIEAFNSGHRTKEKSNMIYWMIKEPPIVFGKNATLYCNASAVENCCSNTVTWMRDFDVILHHGASVDSRKYIQLQDHDGFSLVIKSFDTNDINHQYTCLYDFYEYSQSLNINKRDFQLVPLPQQVISEMNQTSTEILYKVTFQEVFPIPNCSVFINENSVFTNTTIDEQQNGPFSRATIQFVCENKVEYCGGNINVDCYFVKKKMTVYRGTLSSECDVTGILVSTPGEPMDLFVVCAVIVTTIAAVLLTVWMIRKKITSKFCIHDQEVGFPIGRIQALPWFRRTNATECTLLNTVYSNMNVLDGFKDKNCCNVIPAQTSKDVIKLLDYCVKNFYSPLLMFSNEKLDKARSLRTCISAEYCSEVWWKNADRFVPSALSKQVGEDDNETLQRCEKSSIRLKENLKPFKLNNKEKQLQKVNEILNEARKIFPPSRI